MQRVVPVMAKQNSGGPTDVQAEEHRVLGRSLTDRGWLEYLGQPMSRTAAPGVFLAAVFA